jgi:hypothetical protein
MTHSTGGSRSPGPPRNKTGEVATRNRHLGLALLVIATAQLMIVLDATIVNVASRTSSWHSDSPAAAWNG